MRGVGQTELMIANLPAEQCTIVTPTAEMGRCIAKRVKQANPGLRRYIAVRCLSDIQKLSGLCEPVFFDHSFFDHVSEDVAKAAVGESIQCAQMHNWKAAK